MNKSFLKWAGGKSKLLPIILDEIGSIQGTYIEPFLGSGVVALNVPTNNCLVADINDDLINVFKQLKYLGPLFIKYSEVFFEEEFKNSDSFYKLRTRFNSTSDDLERAALFIYLNRNAFNGLCRYNASGGFNVPFGKYKTVYFPRKEMFAALSLIQNFTFKTCGFEELFSFAKKGDVIYADPPYVPLSNSANFTSYAGNIFGLREQQKLAHLAEQSKAKVLISNHDIEFTRRLYKNATKIIEVDVARHIGAKASSRNKVKELIAVFEK